MLNKLMIINSKIDRVFIGSPFVKHLKCKQLNGRMAIIRDACWKQGHVERGFSFTAGLLSQFTFNWKDSQMLLHKKLARVTGEA
jgi:hypothetical protein